VRIIATSAVVDRIDMVYQEKIDKWKKILGSGATSHAVAIEKVDGNFIEFESAKIEVLKNIQGDTDENTMLWIPGQRFSLLAMSCSMTCTSTPQETDRKARGKWLNSLQKIRELNLRLLFLDIARLERPLTRVRPHILRKNYLLVFDEETQKSQRSGQLYQHHEGKIFHPPNSSWHGTGRDG